MFLRPNMVTFPGDPPFQVTPFFQRSKGDRFNLSLLSMATHLGTHVDPPAHYLDGGATVDQIPVDVFVGPGIVLDMTGKPWIDRSDLEGAPIGDYPRVLLKTDNGPKLLKAEFDENYVHLTQSGARYLVERGACLVGIDYLSIEAYHNTNAPVHTILAEAGVLVVEGVNLLEVPAGPCVVYCLPLKIAGGDGAPARVLVETG
jgi:arylformamidase